MAHAILDLSQYRDSTSRLDRRKQIASHFKGRLNFFFQHGDTFSHGLLNCKKAYYKNIGIDIIITYYKALETR